MNAFLLLIPFLLIRFGLLLLLNKNAVERAAHFAPVCGKEKIAYVIYQLSTLFLFIYLLFLTVHPNISFIFIAGCICYILGLILCAIAAVYFAKPNSIGLNTNGIYRFSRNPMYLAYFFCFIGMALLTQSLILLSIILLFQISAHWIILSEERWCIQTFGVAYQNYMKRVRRYL